jgi:Family of unknown function (DUF6519)/Right handed beta helix region
MSFDASRFSFHPWRDYLGVIMQQGRVQLDADWNEWGAELGRRIQAGTLDTVGRAVVPRTTPTGFEILAAGKSFTIGIGRMYVDGLLVENHGSAAEDWDKQLAEPVGAKAVDFFSQPYLPFNDGVETSAVKVFNKPELQQNIKFLAYLDVWQREITHLQDPDLIEKAVGVDTTGRLQTVWQVKVLQDIGEFSCFSPDTELAAWESLIRPSGARLSCSTGEVEGEMNPCLLPQNTGYTGLENQLYRVEIHRGGDQGGEVRGGGATFKWSRDNGTVAARVLAIHEGRRLVVDSLGRDEVLGFHPGDWIEIVDSWHELHGIPGRLHRILPGSGIDAATRSITLETALPVDLFPVDKDGKTDGERQTIIRRWDQAGRIRREDGTIYHDLSELSVSQGIPVPPAGTRLFLENGILIDFSLAGKGRFHHRDHWLVAARSTDATIEELFEAPPRGIHHHYARLALLTLPDQEASCRVLWPPEMVGRSCDCTVCVDAQGHNSGVATIQEAIDVVRELGGGTVCLEAGTYLLRSPLNVINARSLRLRGQGAGTMLRTTKAGTAITVSRGSGVVLENLAITTINELASTAALLTIKDCTGLHCKGLTLTAAATTKAKAAAIDLSGLIIDACIEDCIFMASQGVSAILGETEYLLTADLRLRNNIFLCEDMGINLGGNCLHYGPTRLADNFLLHCAQTGILVNGATLSGSSVSIADNVLQVAGSGIIAGSDGVRIEGNEIVGIKGKIKNHGIVLRRDSGLQKSLPLTAVQLTANSIKDLRGDGIVIAADLGTATIDANTISNLAGSALAMQPGTSAEVVHICNNRCSGLGLGFNLRDAAFFGVVLRDVHRVDISNNYFEKIGGQAEQSPLVAGIAAMATRQIRVAGNRFAGCGPEEFAGRTITLLMLPGFAEAMVVDNWITREVRGRDIRASRWQALVVDGGGTGDEEVVTDLPVFSYLDRVVALPLSLGSFAYLSAMGIAIFESTAKISVRGNVMRNRSTGSATVLVQRLLSCLFQENDVEVVNSGSIPIGEITCEHAGISNNRLVAGREISLRVQVGKSTFVVIGNLRTGPIMINNTPDSSLAPPWNSLNITI